MSWAWLNIPMGVLIVLAIAGIPMWLVIKHPDARPALTGAARPEPAGPRFAGIRRPALARVQTSTATVRIPLRAGTQVTR
jgi:hypothetical protein